MSASIHHQDLVSEGLYTSVSSTDDTEWSAGILYKTSGNDKGNWGSDRLSDLGVWSGSQATLGLLDENHLPNQNPLSRRWKNLRSHLPTGWKFGAWIATIQAGIVLLVNLSIAIWTAVKVGAGTSGVVFQGDCDTVDRLSIGIHLVINVLSTLLLGASNYVMQSLCAPTRAEVDKAHANGSWLDIGLQSVHNLKYASVLISAQRKGFKIIQISYNSSFFSALGAIQYTTIIVSGPDIQQIPENGSYDWKWSSSNFYVLNDSDLAISEWKFLDASTCLRAYATEFVADRGDVLIVTNYTTNDTVVPLGFSMYLDDLAAPFAWICSGMVLEQKSCTDVWSSINSSNWTVQASISVNPWEAFYAPVKYCISQPMEAWCQLESNLPLLAIIIIFNAVKVICMVIVATKMKDHPLVTVGDAIASFVQDPDLDTRGMCLVSASHFQDQPEGQSQYVTGPQPIEYQPHSIRWMSAASPKHWKITILPFITAIAIVLGLLAFALAYLHETSFSALWQLGLGKAHAETIIRGWIPSQGYGILLATVLISNSPQLILSVIYILFNSLCTKLFLALELSAYSRSRKTLRVSYPKGGQRSTYFLQIPYRFSLPLLIYSALLHWLVSQSIFLVKVNYWDSALIQELSLNSSITSCGFSPVGMILTSIVGGSLLLIALAMGYFRHLNGDMPLAGSCSAAIAAACHAPKGDSPLKPVKWGMVSGEGNSGEDVGHISFSSGAVTKPVIGHCYT